VRVGVCRRARFGAERRLVVVSMYLYSGCDVVIICMNEAASLIDTLRSDRVRPLLESTLACA
jgi:hypothetical protein